MAVNVEEMQVGVAEVVDYSKITGVFAKVLREVVQRGITAGEAKKRGIVVSDEELQKSADVFRASNKLKTAGETETWLKERGLTLDALESYLETNLYIYKLKEELVKEADKEKYYAAPVVKDTLRQMAYEEWLKEQVK